MADSAMTPDPIDVIAGWLWRGWLWRGDMDGLLGESVRSASGELLDALTAAGLQIVPIPDADARQRTFGVRWLRNGDHPGDALGELLDDPMGGPPDERLEGKVVRFFRSPDYPGEEVHECGHRWHDHGWLDFPDGGETVCPGDWVVIDAAYLGRTD